MEKREVEDTNKQMGWKWVSIPYSILVLLFAGASYNLHERWELVIVEQGYKKTSHNYTQMVVLFGYYFGILSGIIIHYLDVIYAYAIAAVLAFIGYVGLGIVVVVDEGSTYHLIVTLIFLFIAAFSGSVATFAAIVTPVKNFPRLASLMVIVIMIGYYHIAPLLEEAVRQTWYHKVNKQVYYSCLGAVLFGVYFVGGVLVRQVYMREKHEAMVLNTDK